MKTHIARLTILILICSGFQSRVTPKIQSGLKYAGRFYFVSAHGYVLQAHTDGEMHASQEVQNVGEEERWNVYVWPDGLVSLQNFRTNLFLSAQPTGQAIANRPQADIWEKWTLHGVNGRVAFLSYHHKYLSAAPPGQDTRFGGEVIADRDVCADWEHFSMIPSDGVKEVNNTWWNSVTNAINVAAQLAPVVIPIIP